MKLSQTETDRLSLDPSTWAVVIPSFNHADDALACLQSLRAANPTPGTVVLVDDASTDNAVELITQWAASEAVPCTVLHTAPESTPTAPGTWLTILVLVKNSGFSVACNAGLRYVHKNIGASHALLLNNDAAVSESYFEELAKGMQADPAAGIATGTIYEWDRKTVWYAGGKFNPLRAVAEHSRVVPQDGKSRSTSFVCGCTMLVSRELMDSIGFLPECYSPCYCEDADYSLSASRAGFSLLYVPRAIAYHRVSSSLGGAVRPPHVIYWFNRNRGYVIRRNFAGWRRVAGFAFLGLSKPLRAAWELVRGRPKSASAYIRGTFAGLFLPIERMANEGD